MACVELLDALKRAEDEARKLGQSFAIYGHSGLFIIEKLVTRTGLELEIVTP
jgi:hypothetical protein